MDIDYEEARPVVPCYECICVAICRKKQFNKMLSDCVKLTYFYYNKSYGEYSEVYGKRIRSIKIALKTERLRV